MSQTVLKDMNESSSKFKTLFVPILKRMLRYRQYNSEILQVEDLNEEIAKVLDLKCGIDYVILYESTDLCYGIAARVQKGRNWKTFTIRESRASGAKTEKEKRQFAIKNNGIYPKLTVQGYVENNEVLGIAVMSTKDLFSYIDLNSPGMKRNKTGADKIGQAWFLVCPWDDIVKHNYRIFIYDKETGITQYKGGNNGATDI